MANGLSVSLEQLPPPAAERQGASQGAGRHKATPAGKQTQVGTPAILQRIAAGDQSAVSDCLNAYGNLVWSLARRYLHNQADAEDAVQDIFIEIWRSAGRYDPQVAREATFISVITRRQLIDRIRHKQRQPRIDSIDEEFETRHPAVAPTHDNDAEVALVLQVMQGLEPQHREILSMSLYEGYSHSEIAKILDMPLGTVKTRVRRGLIYVRDKMQLARESD